jgi:hypothetical protein
MVTTFAIGLSGLLRSSLESESPIFIEGNGQGLPRLGRAAHRNGTRPDLPSGTGSKLGSFDLSGPDRGPATELEAACTGESALRAATARRCRVGPLRLEGVGGGADEEGVQGGRARGPGPGRVELSRIRANAGRQARPRAQDRGR